MKKPFCTKIENSNNNNNKNNIEIQWILHKNNTLFVICLSFIQLNANRGQFNAAIFLSDYCYCFLPETTTNRIKPDYCKEQWLSRSIRHIVLYKRNFDYNFDILDSAFGYDIIQQFLKGMWNGSGPMANQETSLKNRLW